MLYCGTVVESVDCSLIPCVIVFDNQTAMNHPKELLCIIVSHRVHMVMSGEAGTIKPLCFVFFYDKITLTFP